MGPYTIQHPRDFPGSAFADPAGFSDIQVNEDAKSGVLRVREHLTVFTRDVFQYVRIWQ